MRKTKITFRIVTYDKQSCPRILMSVLFGQLTPVYCPLLVEYVTNEYIWVTFENSTTLQQRVILSSLNVLEIQQTLANHQAGLAISLCIAHIDYRSFLQK